jgi:hypothetical protein
VGVEQFGALVQDDDALGGGVAARVGQRLADDAQHLGPAASLGPGGQQGRDGPDYLIWS